MEKKVLNLVLSIIFVSISIFILFNVINCMANEYLKDNKEFVSLISAMVGVNTIITLSKNLFSQHNENKDLKILHEDLQLLHNDIDNLKNVVARQNQNTTTNKNRRKKK